jgi:hypothetical protein
MDLGKAESGAFFFFEPKKFSALILRLRNEILPLEMIMHGLLQ